MTEFLIDDFGLIGSRLPDAWIDPLSQGADWGSPEPIERTVESFLRNDAIVRIDGWAGRVWKLNVAVRGENRAAVADMVARLHLATQRPRTLTLVPEDDWGAPSRWRIHSAKLVPISQDLAKNLGKNYRAYTLEMKIEAWAHSTEEWTVTPTADQITGGAVAFGWKGWVGTLNVPGSAPTEPVLDISIGAVGALIYTAPASVGGVSTSGMFETTPSSRTGPRGTYHLVAAWNATGGAVTAIDWSVAGQTGRTQLNPAGGSNYWRTIATGLALTGPATATLTAVGGGSLSEIHYFLLWMGDPLTGETGAAYSSFTGGAGSGLITLSGPTPDYPLWSYSATNRSVVTFGRHQFSAGGNRLFVAGRNGVDFTIAPTASCYPAWHTEAVPSSRWAS